MSRLIRAMGHGLLAAGGVLIFLLFAGAYLKGPETFRDALDPFAIGTYLTLLPLVPGTLLIWLADLMSARRRVEN